MKANRIQKSHRKAAIAVKLKLPHFTAEEIFPMFQSKSIELDGSKVVPLLDGASGYLKFSDNSGGTAYLVDSETDKKLASFSINVTHEMRERKCFSLDCKCGGDWRTLITGCSGNDEHEGDYDTYLVPVRLYARLCENPKCTEQHVWLLSECIDSHHHYNNHAQIL